MDGNGHPSSYPLDCGSAKPRNQRQQVTAGQRPVTHQGDGDVAQLGERRFCKAEVVGSIPIISTIET